MPPRPHLFGLLPEEIAAHLRDAGVAVRDDEARRILAHRLPPKGKHAPTRPLGKRLLGEVAARFDDRHLEVLERAADPDDGFVKYLFRSPDGALSEAVRIPLEKKDCFSVCLSSQVGCAMKCGFCATGRLGLARHLEPWEMVDAFRQVRDEAPGRVTGAVFQGQGEPFHNYDAVLRAARILSHPCGGRVRGDAITISTVGIVPRIHQYAAEGHRYRLIVSMTSAIEGKRAALLPVAAKWSLGELADALRAYAAANPRLTTIAWVLMGGVNDGPEEAEALHRMLGDLRLRINLIDVNDARPDGYRRSTDEERKRFVNALQVLKAPVVRRYSGGFRRHAACGMLAATRWGGVGADGDRPYQPAHSR